MNLQRFLPKLPDYLIKTTVFTYELGGVNIDYEVTYTVFGEMIKVKNDFDKLPKEAQRLMLGANYEEKLAAIEAYGKLFKYKIPLVVFGYHKEGIWRNVYLETNAITTSELDWYIAAAPLYFVDNWVMNLWRKFQNEPQSKEFNVLIDLFFKPKKRGRALDDFNQNNKYFSLNTEFLQPLFLTYVSTSNKLKGIESFGNYPTKKNYELLVSILKDENKKDFHQTVLTALSKHKMPSLKNILMEYYFTHPKISDSELTALFKGLSHFANTDVKQIFWKNFQNEDKRSTSIELINCLKNIGVSEEEIAKKLTTSLNANKYLGLTLKQFNELKNDDYLPSLSYLLELASSREALIQQKHTDPYVVNQLVERILKQKKKEVLRPLLDFENEDIQKIVVKQFVRRGKVTDIELLLPLLKKGKFIDEITPFFNKMIKENGEIVDLETLIQVYENTQDSYGKKKLISLMRRLVKMNPNAPFVREFFLNQLNDSNSSTKMEIVITLRFIPHEEVIAVLEQTIQVELDKKVKKVAEESLEFIKAPDKFWKNQKARRKRNTTLLAKEIVGLNDEESNKKPPSIGRKVFTFGLEVVLTGVYHFLNKEEEDVFYDDGS